MRDLALVALCTLGIALAGCTEVEPPPDGTEGGGEDPASRPAEGTSAESGDDAGSEEDGPAPSRDEMVTPMADLEVGDWAVYVTHTDQRDIHLRFEATDTSPTTVTFRITRLEGPEGPRAGEGREEEMDLVRENNRYTPPDELEAPAPTVSTETYRLRDGRTLECTVYRRDFGDSSVENWYHEDVPAFQTDHVVKSLQNEVVRVELIDYGHGE